MVSKGSKFAFVLAGLFALVAFCFGIFVLVGSRLPEGILIIGLGLCVFGVAGIFATMSKDVDTKTKDVARKTKAEKKAEPKSEKKSVEAPDKEPGKTYKISLNPEGAKAVPCELSFGDGMFVANAGFDTLEIPYAEIKELRLDTPVLYIDWQDGTTWEMRFEKITAPAQVYQEFQNRLDVA